MVWLKLTSTIAGLFAVACLILYVGKEAHVDLGFIGVAAFFIVAACVVGTGAWAVSKVRGA